ncbi:hypothetical protein PAMA_015529 [Pampus argenteus]
MMGPRLLFVCWCSSILAVAGCIRVDGYSCTSDYWETVTCILNITGNPVGQSNTTYYLQFTPNSGPCENCLAMKHGYSCACKPTDSYFISENVFSIDVCHESDCTNLNSYFLPSQNIQLTPPHKPDVQQTAETFNITWKSGYESHDFLDHNLDYELFVQKSQSNKGNTLHSKTESVLIQRSQLKPGAIYCIKMRSKPSIPDYDATWSKWSPKTCWETEAGEEQKNLFAILMKSLGPVCVVIGVLLFVLNSPAGRMKIKTLSHTPSPAPFFQPLFKQHEGNFQEWLSPQGKFVLTNKTEEIISTDAVIIAPKPVSKAPEENQDFHNPPVTQLAFTQCQTSYVGLPGMHEASPPLPVICPGNTSYTQLPCSIWGFGIGEVEACVSSPPNNFLDISHADSGCSCDDFTQSPECSLPNSPVDCSPPPSNDYCVLNKTAEGVIPVLVSK